MYRALVHMKFNCDIRKMKNKQEEKQKATYHDAARRQQKKKEKKKKKGSHQHTSFFVFKAKKKKKQRNHLTLKVRSRPRYKAFWSAQNTSAHTCPEPCN